MNNPTSTLFAITFFKMVLQEHEYWKANIQIQVVYLQCGGDALKTSINHIYKMSNGII